MARSEWTRKQKGQLLIEAMVAVSLMLVGLLGIFGVLSRSLGLSRVAADQFVAVNLASEGIELAKNIFDSNIENGKAWNYGFTGGDTTVGYLSSELGDCDGEELYLDTESGFYTCSVIRDVRSKFSRTINVTTDPSVERVRVISTVSWTGRGGLASTATVEDHFYNWRDLRS
ncbi:MAG: hypothetical protein UX31_C0019G0012 [Candidatus Nomurabacteria bacterium GW2011_GWA1_46_11]|uniref:Type 4 fimbrial biogenesis protein PilX N-terminal domain-containing protein n=2 Tax=Parcubacteria group TaxID=1794811 RepID=A0A1G1YW20_9BACT|nr:MAG: hypothetical protein UX29_C0001G0068 [Parcubacteria group bacterium GW2011_GWA2_46_10]KKU21283.1 MAG: hypothetical protein UX31_C0019G0012 [Candidatus Nomurabacteria bacterium GW2011_GWA1_46_11]OGY56583.1 MAG: hypothetical protein A2119_01645 [Candidatus Colwellbacteria bacterium GWA2_46_10]